MDNPAGLHLRNANEYPNYGVHFIFPKLRAKSAEDAPKRSELKLRTGDSDS